MRYYRAAISNGIFLLPLIALLPLIPYYWKHRKRGIANPLRLLTFCSFILYMLICWYFVVLPLPSEEWLATSKPAGVNLVPFAYFRYLSAATGFDVMEHTTYFSAIGSNFALQYWFNVLMLLPLGMYLRYLFKLDAKRSALVCLTTTVLFEVTQLTGVFFLFSKPYRSFDVDDIICNFLGGMIGYWLMGLLSPLVYRIEAKAAAAYRNGVSVSVFRRFCAFFIDVNIVWGLDGLITLASGGHPLTDVIHSLTSFVPKLFVYTLLSSLVLQGATIGKWLLRFNVCCVDNSPAPAWRLILRYVILYGTIMLFLLIPYFSQSLPEGSSYLVKQLCMLFGVALLTYYAVASWMFPTGDYPWGTLSRTHVRLMNPLQRRSL